MIKETLDNNAQGRFNDKKIAVLKENFPGCFSGDTFDIEIFKKEINQDIDISSEGYEFNFLGKSYAKYIADSVETETVLAPDLEHNFKPDNSKSENIYITGDNLDVLKHLRKSYSNKIKMIYIDPPYNTGGDGFIYKDNFNFTKEHLIEVLGTDSEDAERILNMTSSNSSSHSAWLTFIYPRLYLGRELLKDDGVIFISIDDHENAQLKLLCDDVFGESNFLADLIWTNKEGGGSSDSKNFRIKHEHILVYAKDISLVNINGVEISNIDRYKLADEHVFTRGKYYTQKLGMGSIQYSKSLDYPIEAPDGSFIYPKDNNNGQQACWRWSKEKLQWGLENDYIVFKQDQNKNWIVYTKQYLNADNEGNIIKRTQRPTGVIDKYSSTQAAKTLEKMKLKPFFDYSKPKELIRYLIDLVVDKGDIILDYFSGSGTTAHAVLERNSEDESYQNKFIMVQLDVNVK